MAFAFQGQVDPENEARTRGYYETLSEKDGRRFAVLQARLQGYGGITYVAGVLGCSAMMIVVDPENWTGALALESPWWGGIQHGTDQEGSAAIPGQHFSS